MKTKMKKGACDGSFLLYFQHAGIQKMLYFDM